MDLNAELCFSSACYTPLAAVQQLRNGSLHYWQMLTTICMYNFFIYVQCDYTLYRPKLCVSFRFMDPQIECLTA